MKLLTQPQLKNIFCTVMHSVELILYILFAAVAVGIVFYSPLLPVGLQMFGTILLILLLAAARYFASWRRWVLPTAWGIILLIWGIFTAFSPVKDADWQVQWERMPVVSIQENHMDVINVRDFSYPDGNADSPLVRYQTETYDLNKAESLDFAVCHWGSDLIGHTMFIFRFSDGKSVVLSAETRIRKGESPSSLAKIFKTAQLIWLLGTENDLLRVRTNYRMPREDLYIYPTKTTPDEMRTLLHMIAAKINDLAAHPQFYNTLSMNCTTVLAEMIDCIYPDIPWDYRTLLTGYSDQFAFDLGWLKRHNHESYAMFRARHLVNLRVCDLPDTATAQDYTAKVMEAR